MNFIAIDTQSYEKKKESFNRFLSEMQRLCKFGKIQGKWIDTQEVCLLLNISKRSLHNYKIRGFIPFSMIG